MRPAVSSAVRAGIRKHTRRAVGAVVACALAAGLAACSNTETGGVAEQAGSQQGYVSGSGVVTQIPKSERTDPIDLEFTVLDGQKTSLADIRKDGTITVINLWYAACPPCRKEAPELEEVAEKYKGKAQLIGANVRDQEAAAQAFVENFNVSYPVMLDSNGEMVGLLSDVLPPRATPSTVVLDSEGRPAARVVGAVEASTLSGLIDDAMKED